MSRFLDYVPPVIAFIAALVAIVGAPKWNDSATGLLKLTPLGWAVFGIGLAALLSSSLLTKRSHATQRSQTALREEIRRIGQAQILRSIRRITSVFRNSNLWHQGTLEPTSPLDLLDSERRSALAALNLNSRSPYYDGKIYPKWWAMFENTAKQGSEQLTTALQIYVTFLEPELIFATTKLLNGEFMHRLQHIHSIIDANTADNPERPVTFFWIDPEIGHPCGYEEFWNQIAKVVQQCNSQGEAGLAQWNDSGRDG